MLELQIQIYIIIGVFAFLLAGLILANSLITYYLVKLYKKISNEANENSYLRKHSAAFNNSGINLDDELSRRYTMHTLERADLETFKYDENRIANKESTKTQNVVKSSHGGSVIDVSEQFIMKRQNLNENSRYNPNITMSANNSRSSTVQSIHELRTNFNNNDTF